MANSTVYKHVFARRYARVNDFDAQCSLYKGGAAILDMSRSTFLDILDEAPFPLF